jgi:hypothetical protein
VFDALDAAERQRGGWAVTPARLLINVLMDAIIAV